jgi:HEAT repeat protein
MALLLAFGCSSFALGDEEPTFKQLLEELLPGMGAESIPDRREPQQRFQGVCFQLGAPGREAERAAACTLMADKLGPEIAKPARIWLLKQLQFIGQGECVDAVAAVLDDEDPHVRDAARRALQNNPAPEASAKLLAKLPEASGSWRVGLINSLGARRDPASVPALVRLLGGPDEAAAAAAANALGKIGGPEATQALAAALAGAPGRWKARVADAYLRCADKLLADGNRDAAAAIYEHLYRPESPRTIRLAALQGILNAAGDEATERILKLLQSDDPDERAIAAGQVESVLGAGALRTAEKTFPKLSPRAKALLLAALAVHGDTSMKSVALAAVDSDDQTVRLAGIRALGRLGDASVVPLLAEAVASGGAESDAARDSLERLSADGLAEAIVARLEGAEPGTRLALIDVLDRRRAITAVPALLQQAEHEDGGVRSRAMAALGNLASPEHVPELVERLLETPKGRERDDAEKAIMLVCRRIEEAEGEADPVLAQFSEASDEERSMLFPLLGRIGGPKALDAIHDGMKSQNAEIRDAAARALCNWPDPSVADELLALAESSEDERYRTWALRAYVRVIGLPTDRPARESLDMFQRAMELARRHDEKRLVIGRVSTVRTVETLRFVVPYLDEEALAQQACRTVVELAHHRDLREPNRREFDPALEKVIAICRDPELGDRAKRYLEGL